MYSDIKVVQIIISLLKQKNIRNIVISPGTRNTALVHSVENDTFFRCYSFVDERSAAYFALGMSEELDEPVCVTCTAATATCNYFPAIQEAYERNIQLVALTADNDRNYMFQTGEQTIDQINMYGKYVNESINIPLIKDSEEEWVANREINKALLELNHRRKGPVQINYNMWYPLERLAKCDIEELPTARNIELLKYPFNWEKIQEQLLNKKRIIVYLGSGEKNKEVSKLLKRFFEVYNCTVVSDHFSNIRFEGVVNLKCLGDVLNEKEISRLLPDLIITFGDVYYSTAKNILRQCSKDVQHWNISEEGVLNDGFKHLTTIYECSPSFFFENVIKNVNTENDKLYWNNWNRIANKIKFPDLKFTNFYTIQQFIKVLPENSLLHLSILDSIRITNYFDLHETIECYANVGADGIDGTLSTFFGQAMNTREKAFLVIGDLSFLYDINAVFSKLGKNVRILLINNFAGAEFHKNFGIEKIPTINDYIAAGHKTKLEDFCFKGNIKYLTAKDEETLDKSLKDFVSDKYDGPIILEVFTNAELDAETLKRYWKINKTTTVIRLIKNIVKKILRRI